MSSPIPTTPVYHPRYELIGFFSIYNGNGQFVASQQAQTQLQLTGPPIQDDLSCWSSGSPDQFIIPAGVTHARITANMDWNNQLTGGTVQGCGRLLPTVNGSRANNPVFGNTMPLLPGSGNGAAHALDNYVSAFRPVTPGDVWTFGAVQTTGQDLQLVGTSAAAEFYRKNY